MLSTVLHTVGRMVVLHHLPPSTSCISDVPFPASADFRLLPRVLSELLLVQEARVRRYLLLRLLSSDVPHGDRLQPLHGLLPPDAAQAVVEHESAALHSACADAGAPPGDRSATSSIAYIRLLRRQPSFDYVRRSRSAKGRCKPARPFSCTRGQMGQCIVLHLL